MANKLSHLTTALVGTQTRHPLAQAMKTVIMDEIQRRRLAGDDDDDLAIVFSELYGPVCTGIMLTEILNEVHAMLTNILVQLRLESKHFK